MRSLCLILLSAMLLSGCTTFKVTPAYWLHPGYAAMADKVLPQIETNGYTATSLSFAAKDGTRLHGLLLTRPDARVTVVFYPESNFQLGTFGVETALEFEPTGVNVFLFEYRGYGQSEGKPSLDTMQGDALAAWDYVRALPQTNGQPMLAYGASLGSFIAPKVALQRPIDGLVLESTATTVEDWGHHAVPWWAKPFVSLDIQKDLLTFNNEKALARYHGPLLLLGGSKDEVTPPRFARELMQVSATPADQKMLYISPTRGHANVLLDPDGRKALARFLDQVVMHD